MGNDAHHITTAADLLSGDAYIEKIVAEYKRRGVPLQVPTRHSFGAIPTLDDDALFASASYTSSSTLITSTVGSVFARSSTLTSTGYARNIIFTSAGDDSARVWTITGTDIFGSTVKEAVTGTNAGIATSVKTFATVSSIVPSATSAGNLKIGFGNQIGLPYRIDNNNQIVVFANGKMVERYYLSNTLAVLGTASAAISVAPIGGTVASLTAASSANNANANATLSVATGGANILTSVLLSNYVANTAQSNSSPIATTKAIAGGAVIAVATDGGGDGAGTVNTQVAIDPYVLTTAVTTSPATSTTGDVRGKIDLGGAPNTSISFSAIFFIDASTTERARGVAQYVG